MTTGRINQVDARAETPQGNILPINARCQIGTQNDPNSAAGVALCAILEEGSRASQTKGKRRYGDPSSVLLMRIHKMRRSRNAFT